MESGMIHSPEEDRAIREKVTAIFKRLFARKDNSFVRLQKEIVERNDYLKKKYPNASKYAVLYQLTGKTIGSDTGIIYQDFPGEDSIGSFLDYLAEKYK